MMNKTPAPRMPRRRVRARARALAAGIIKFLSILRFLRERM